MDQIYLDLSYFLLLYYWIKKVDTSEVSYVAKKGALSFYKALGFATADKLSSAVKNDFFQNKFLKKYFREITCEARGFWKFFSPNSGSFRRRRENPELGFNMFLNRRLQIKLNSSRTFYLIYLRLSSFF